MTLWCGCPNLPCGARITGPPARRGVAITLSVPASDRARTVAANLAASRSISCQLAMASTLGLGYDKNPRPAAKAGKESRSGTRITPATGSGHGVRRGKRTEEPQRPRSAGAGVRTDPTGGNEADQNRR
jgi:hypothetical protein